MGKFLTEKEASEYLGVSESDFKKLAERRKLPVYKIGGTYIRFKLDDLDLLRRKKKTELIKLSGDSGLRQITDKVLDFFYFNDFYILSTLIIAALIYFIFRPS